MDLSFNDNEVMVKETAQQLGTKLLTPHAVEMDRQGEIFPDVIDGIARQG